MEMMRMTKIKSVFKENVKRRLHRFSAFDGWIYNENEHVEVKIIGEYNLDFVLKNHEKVYLSDIDRVVRVHEGFKSTDGSMIYTITDTEIIEDEKTKESYAKAIQDRDLYRERQKHREAERDIERREEAIEQLEAERRKQEWRAETGRENDRG